MLIAILVLQVMILLGLGGIVNKLKELLTKIETLKIENIRLLDILSEMEKSRRKEVVEDEQITKEKDEVRLFIRYLSNYPLLLKLSFYHLILFF